MQIKIPADQAKIMGLKSGAEVKIKVSKMGDDGAAECEYCEDKEPAPKKKSKRSPAVEAAIMGS